MEATSRSCTKLAGFFNIDTVHVESPNPRPESNDAPSTASIRPMSLAAVKTIVGWREGRCSYTDVLVWQSSHPECKSTIEKGEKLSCSAGPAYERAMLRTRDDLHANSDGIPIFSLLISRSLSFSHAVSSYFVCLLQFFHFLIHAGAFPPFQRRRPNRFIQQLLPASSPGEFQSRSKTLGSRACDRASPGVGVRS